MSQSGRELRVAVGLLSENDLCEILDVKPQTLQAWRSNKIGPDYTKLGKGVFYRADDVQKWAELNLVVTRRAGVDNNIG